MVQLMLDPLRRDTLSRHAVAVKSSETKPGISGGKPWPDKPLIPPFHGGDRVTFSHRPQPSLQFEGQKKDRSFFKTFILGLASLPGMLTSTAVPPGDLFGDESRTQYLDTTLGLSLMGAAEDARYKTIAQAWQSAEAQPVGSGARSSKTAEVRGHWDRLLSDARNGNAGAHQVAHRLLRDQLYNEIAQPGPHLIRFNYYGYDDLISRYNAGQMNRQTFNTEMQWRALEGLVNHLGNQPYQTVREAAPRFYPVVRQALDTNSDDRVQKWGQYTLQRIFGGLTPEQQTDNARKLSEVFLKEPPGNKKQFAMRGLTVMRGATPSLPLWEELREKVQERLKNPPMTESHDAKKFYIIYLGQTQDPTLPALVEPLIKPESPEAVQQAAAWSLGRVMSPKGLDLLTKMLENDKLSPVAQEMAVYSIENYRSQYQTHVMNILNNYAKESPAVNDDVEEAARAMLEKAEDQSRVEPEFYIKRLLKNEEDRTLYRKIRSQYVKGWDNLNMSQQNFLDRALIPYRKYLPEIIRRQGEHTIIRGTVTETPEYKYLVGYRADDGRLYDDIEGISSVNGAVTSAMVMNPGRFNTFSHEFWHHLHQMVLNNRPGYTRKIEDFYHQGKALDYYAASNEYEFLAQGGEAYNARFKDHEALYTLVFDKGFQSTDNHTRSQLKRQDPELFKFIEGLTCVDCNLEKHAVEMELKKAVNE